MKSAHILLFFCLAVALVSSEDLRVDTEELQGALKEGIVFENYEGVPDKIETVAQIRGIGTALAGEGQTSSTGKYTVIHAVDPSLPQGLDADIFILEPSATVDHIRNLRWIIGSYLEAQYGYSRADADLLAQFLTIYNAVYRKNLAYFKERYKPVVLAYLDAEKVGLARSYREWRGKTQMLIPLSGLKKKGILSIETGPLTEKPIVEELRKQEDRGIPLRKEMVELKDRQLKEEERQLEEEKKALQLEKEKQQREPVPQEPSQEAKADLKGKESSVKEEAQTPSQELPPQTSPSSPSPQTAPSSIAPPASGVTTGTEGTPSPPGTPRPEAPPAEPPSQSPISPSPPASASPSQAPVPIKEEKSTEEKSTIASITEKEQELKDRERQLEEKQKALREERVAIAKDQQELLESKALQIGKTVPFLFVEKEGWRLVLLEENTGAPAIRSSEFPLEQSMVQSFGGGYLVVLARGGTGGKLALLDPASLQARVTSREEVYGLGKVRVHESVCFAILKEGNEWFVGKFDTALALLARSRVAVLPETDLAIQGDKLYVQTTDGRIAVLNLELASP